MDFFEVIGYFVAIWISFSLLYYNLCWHFDYNINKLRSNYIDVALSFALVAYIGSYLSGVFTQNNLIEIIINKLFIETNYVLLFINSLCIALSFYFRNFFLAEQQKNNLFIQSTIRIMKFIITCYIFYFSLSFFYLLIGLTDNINKTFLVIIEKTFELTNTNYEISVIDHFEKYYDMIQYLYIFIMAMCLLIIINSIIIKRRSIFFMAGGIRYIYDAVKLHKLYNTYKMQCKISKSVYSSEFIKENKKKLKKNLKNGILIIENKFERPNKINRKMKDLLSKSKKNRKIFFNKYLDKKIKIAYFFNKYLFLFFKRKFSNAILVMFFTNIIYNFYMSFFIIKELIIIENYIAFHKINTLTSFFLLISYVATKNKKFLSENDRVKLFIPSFSLAFLYTLQNIVYEYTNDSFFIGAILFFIFLIRDSLVIKSNNLENKIILMFLVYIAYEVFIYANIKPLEFLEYQLLFIGILLCVIFDIEQKIKNLYHGS